VADLVRRNYIALAMSSLLIRTPQTGRHIMTRFHASIGIALLLLSSGCTATPTATEPREGTPLPVNETAAPAFDEAAMDTTAGRAGGHGYGSGN
jgi:hypothetical protein